MSDYAQHLFYYQMQRAYAGKSKFWYYYDAGIRMMAERIIAGEY